jgi:putative endonuclease
MQLRGAFGVSEEGGAGGVAPNTHVVTGLDPVTIRFQKYAREIHRFVIPGRRIASNPESIPPASAKAYYVYLLASRKHGTLHLGVTNDIVRRGYEHRSKAVDGFTARYGVDKLVWFEIYDDAATAIAREKELKKWRRDWKIRLIEEENPGWVDLYPGISN